MPASPWVAVDAGTIPAKLARELRDAWEDFVADGAVDGAEGAGTPGLREPIVDSWLRSRDAGVDPSGRQAAPSIVERGGALDLWDGHPLAAAAPVMDQCMADGVVATDHLLVVSDADGMLLSVRGDPHLRMRASDDMNFIEGALWSESGAGTNAVGTAVAAGHAVQVFAAEHFTEPVQRWTCAAAPVFDPDGGALLGVIDLTGDVSAVNAHSLAVVVATARAVEGRLRDQMHERDGRLRSRFARRLDAAPGEAGLVTGTGRVLAGGTADWHRDGAPVEVPAAGGRMVLPSGRPAVAEPVGEADLYVVRPEQHSARAARPLLELRLLGGEPQVRLDGKPLTLRPRHVELLTLLAVRRTPASADVLCSDLYGDDGQAASVRVEMSRLRKLLGGAIDTASYRLLCNLDADFARVTALLDRNAVRDAAEAYPGKLLPDSVAPGIERERRELDGWVRQAVLTSSDPEALWAWAQTPSGEDDLLAWRRLLGTIAYDDPRRSRVAARTAALRASPELL